MGPRAEKNWRRLDRILWFAVAVLFVVLVLLLVLWRPELAQSPAPPAIGGPGGSTVTAVRPGGASPPGTEPRADGGGDEPMPARGEGASSPRTEDDGNSAAPPPLDPAHFESTGTPIGVLPPPAADLLTDGTGRGSPGPPSEDTGGSRLAGTRATPSSLAAAVQPERIFAARRGQAKTAALARFGGNAQTQAAVADALAWLARHQDADGRWDRLGFSRHCPEHDRCGQEAIGRVDRDFDVGLTALVLLAFLGDGHLPNDPDDPYRETTRKAIDWLLAQQRDGRFGPLQQIPNREPRDPMEVGEFKPPMLLYNQSVATLALAEAYAMTRDPRLVEPVMAGVAVLGRTQQPEGGWDYWPQVTHRNDTSIAGWAVMALKSAGAAGLPVPATTLYRAAAHFTHSTEADGRVWYADAGTGISFDSNTGAPLFRYGPAMTAVGVFSRQLLGYRMSNPPLLAGANLVRRQPPSLEALRGRDRSLLHSEYYWYYGTAAMFQMGGQWWSDWNGPMQQAVLGGRDATVLGDGQRSHRYGSWTAYGSNWGTWGAQGSRIYATAIAALTLEVYYRYLPLYELAWTVDYGPVVEQVMAAQPSDRLRMIEWLGQLRAELAEPILYRLARSPDSHVRFRAAIELAGYGSPLAKPIIERERNWLSPADRLLAEQTLAETAWPAVPGVFGAVRRVDTKENLVSFDIGESYVGFGLPAVVLDGNSAATARLSVISIDRKSRTAIGRLNAEDRRSWSRLAPGMTVKMDWGN